MKWTNKKIRIKGKNKKEKVHISWKVVQSKLTATTEFVISNGCLAQAWIQFESGLDIIYNEGNSGFDTFRNAFNSDQDYQDFDADLQI